MTVVNGYAPVNGLRMYYQIEGTGDPLVFIHPALGFGGLESFPTLTERHTLITVDLQGHGRTADIPVPFGTRALRREVPNGGKIKWRFLARAVRHVAQSGTSRPPAPAPFGTRAVRHFAPFPFEVTPRQPVTSG